MATKFNKKYSSFWLKTSRFLLSVWLLSLLGPTLVFGNLQSRFEFIIRSTELKQTTISLVVADVTDHRTLVKIHADKPMMPASNMKLVTTASALGILGPDFVFQTQLHLTAPTGDTASLVILGDGDPSFGDPKILKKHKMGVEELIQVWVLAVKKSGIKHINRLFVDDRVFDHQFVHPLWPKDQLQYWYCAQVSGLNFHDNCLDIYPRPTQKNQAPLLKISPWAPFLKLFNRALTGKSDSFWVNRRKNSNELTFRGTVRNSRVTPISVTIHDPALFFAKLFASRLVDQGITVQAVVRPSSEEILPPSTPIHIVRTTIDQVLARCNKDSQNLFAEALLKRMGRKFTGMPGSWSNGAAAVRTFLQKRLGASSSSILVSDGSGMSRENRISAAHMVNLLTMMYRDQALRKPFIQSMAIGHVDGTIKARFKAKLHGVVHAKTGFIKGVSALSGYLIIPRKSASTTQHAARETANAVSTKMQEHVYAFSMLFNGFKPPLYNRTFKKLQEKLVKEIDRYDQRLKRHN